MSKTQVVKVRELPRAGKGKKEKILHAPETAEGYYRIDQGKDGMTITYRKVA